MYSSTSVNHFKARPSLVRSCKKSQAQTWPLYPAGRRTQLLALLPSRRFFRCFRGTLSPCCRQSLQTRLRLTRQPSRRSKAQIRR